MDKKKILIGLGVVAVIGIAYYLYNKNKKDATSGESNDTTPTSDATNTTKSAEAPIVPLEKRKEKRKACGRKPLNKQKRAEWQKCVDAGGSVSFEGDFDEFQDDYMD